MCGRVALNVLSNPHLETASGRIMHSDKKDDSRPWKEEAVLEFGRVGVKRAGENQCPEPAPTHCRAQGEGDLPTPTHSLDHNSQFYAHRSQWSWVFLRQTRDTEAPAPRPSHPNTEKCLQTLFPDSTSSSATPLPSNPDLWVSRGLDPYTQGKGSTSTGRARVSLKSVHPKLCKRSGP